VFLTQPGSCQANLLGTRPCARARSSATKTRGSDGVDSRAASARNGDAFRRTGQGDGRCDLQSGDVLFETGQGIVRNIKM